MKWDSNCESWFNVYDYKYDYEGERDLPDDDVDESNYDPYMGCDFYETYDMGDGWHGIGIDY